RNQAVIDVWLAYLNFIQYGTGNLSDAGTRPTGKSTGHMRTLSDQNAFRDQRAISKRRQVSLPAVQSSNDLNFPGGYDSQPFTVRRFVTEKCTGFVRDHLSALDDRRQFGYGHAHRTSGYIE